MSQEDLAVVRRMYEAFNAGDYEACLNLLASDIEYHELEGVPGARGMVGVYRGRDEVAGWFGEFLSGWEPGFQSEPHEITDLGGGQVVVAEVWHGRGAKSRADVSAGAAALYTIREGLITRVRYFRDREEALEAVGLRE